MLVYQRVSPPKKTLILGDAQKKHLRIRSEARQRWRSQRHRANSPRAEGYTRPRWGSHSAPLEAPGPEQQLSGHGEFSKNESSWHRKKNLGNKKKNTMSDSLSLGSNLIQSPVGSQLAASWQPVGSQLAQSLHQLHHQLSLGASSLTTKKGMVCCLPGWVPLLGHPTTPPLLGMLDHQRSKTCTPGLSLNYHFIYIYTSIDIYRERRGVFKPYI